MFTLLLSLVREMRNPRMAVPFFKFTAYYRLWFGVPEEQTLRRQGLNSEFPVQIILCFAKSADCPCTTAWSFMLIFVITNFAFCSWHVCALVLPLAPIHLWVERWAAFTSDFSVTFSIPWINLRSVSMVHFLTQISTSTLVKNFFILLIALSSVLRRVTHGSGQYIHIGYIRYVLFQRFFFF